MTTPKPKYYITFTAHDQQGEYKGFVTGFCFNKASGGYSISGRLRSDDAFVFKSAEAAQKKLDAIKKHEDKSASLWPIEKMQVEVMGQNIPLHPIDANA